jgi:hypothetical protein
MHRFRLRSLPLSARSGSVDGRIPAGRECSVCVDPALSTVSRIYDAGIRAAGSGLLVCGLELLENAQPAGSADVGFGSLAAAADAVAGACQWDGV